jgi:hypothetical protein
VRSEDVVVAEACADDLGEELTKAGYAVVAGGI